MGVPAAAALAFTVFMGVIVLALWTGPERRADHRSNTLASAHVPVATATIGVWLAFLITGGSGLAVAGAGLAAGTAALGLATLASSLRRPPAVPALALVLHGAGAALTITLAVIAAVRA